MEWSVVAVIPRAEIAAGELVRAAAAAVAGSEFVLAAPIVAFASEQNLAVESARSTRVVEQLGVVARVARRDVLVGSEELLTQHQVELSRDILREVRLRRARGETALLVAVDDRMLGAMFLAEEENSTQYPVPGTP